MWISQAFSLLGSAIVEFALGWYIARETGSAVVLSTAVLLAILPQVILGPFIGPFVDRWNRKKIMIIADLTIALVTAILVILFINAKVKIWHIYFAMLIRAVGQAFHYPAMQASISMIVPEKHLSRVGGLNQTLSGIMSVISPAAGAFLLNALSIQWVLLVDIITALVAVTCLLFITIPQPLKVNVKLKFSAIGDFKEGVHYIWSWRGLMVLLVLFSVFNLLYTPSMNLLPIFVINNLGGDVLKLGWLGSADGLGFIAGGLLIGIWGGLKKRIFTALIGLGMVGFTILGLGFATETRFILGLICIFLAGTGLAICNAAEGAIIQSKVAKDMQGRIFSLNMSLSMAMSLPGLVIAGQIAELTGMRLLYVITGIGTILIVVIALFIPSVVNIEKTYPEKHNIPSLEA
jgi:MFS transporter, DHA3 family, macrolide efflux protein